MSDYQYRTQVRTVRIEPGIPPYVLHIIMLPVCFFIGWAIGTIFIPDNKLTKSQDVPIVLRTDKSLSPVIIQVKGTDRTMFMTPEEAMALSDKLEAAANHGFDRISVSAEE
tara:strand:- start:12025 stop:12357 length:333 start_codon:yes stop_codon:yes gene_type:complete